MSKSKVNKKLENLIDEYMVTKERIDDDTRHLHMLKESIIKTFDSEGINSYDMEYDTSVGKSKAKKKINFMVVTRNALDFDLDKLKKKLSKKELKKVVNKNYIITDWQEFASTMKRHKISRSEFEDSISCNEVVDVKKMNEMYNVGDFDVDKIKGTYKINTSRYLKVTSRD